MQSSEDSVAEDRRGAIFVEFLIVVLPFLILLFGLAQSALMYLGGLAVQRSAGTAARAAMVVLDDDPERYGGQARNTLGGQREQAILVAASFPLYALWTTPKDSDTLEHAMRAWDGNPYETRGPAIDGLRMKFPGGAPGGRGAPITVRIEYDYPCEVPVVRAIMCPDGTRTIKATATLPNMAANYEYGRW